MDTIEARAIEALMTIHQRHTKKTLPSPTEKNQTRIKAKRAKKKIIKDKRQNRTKQEKTKKKSIIHNVTNIVKDGEQSCSQWAKHGLLEARYTCIRCCSDFLGLSKIFVTRSRSRDMGQVEETFPIWGFDHVQC